MDPPEPKRSRMSNDDDQVHQETRVCTVGVGVTDFSRLIAYDSYVDRTPLIKDIFKGVRHKLVTVPRQFGKTTVISMLKYFSAIEVDNSGQPLSSAVSSSEPVRDTPNHKVFTDHSLKITEDTETMDEHFGKYPVVHVDFDSPLNVTSAKYVTAFCRTVVHRAYKEHEYLLRSTLLPEENKQQVTMWCHEMDHHKFTSEEVSTAISKLCTYLFLHFNKKCLVLVDNYDSVTMKAIATSQFEQSIKEVHNYLSAVYASLLLSDSVQLCFMTGISSFTGVDLSQSNDQINFMQIKNVARHQFMRLWSIARFYGYTEDELRELFKKFKIDDDLTIKALNYYGSYKTADGVELYNFLSISKFLITKKIENYWCESVTGLFIDRMFRISPIEVLKLMIGKLAKIDFEVNNEHDEEDEMDSRNNITINQLGHFSQIGRGDVVIKYDYFPLLLEEGYLTLEKNKSRSVWWATIPNKEIMTEFFDLLSIYTENNFPRFSSTFVCTTLNEISLKSDDSRIRIDNLCRLLNELQVMFTRTYEAMIYNGEYVLDTVFQAILPMSLLLKSETFAMTVDIYSDDDNEDSHNPTTIVTVGECIFIIVFGIGYRGPLSPVELLSRIIGNQHSWADKQLKKCFTIGMSLDLVNQTSTNLYGLKIAYVLKNLTTGSFIKERNLSFASNNDKKEIEEFNEFAGKPVNIIAV